MKVLLFANTDWYLYNFRRSLAVALRGMGHEVLLVSPRGPHAYGRMLEDLGFRWIVAPMERRSLNPLGELSLVLWLMRLMREEKPDLVHSFTIKCSVYGSLAARLRGVPAWVNSVAGMGYVFSSGDLMARVVRPVVCCMMRLALDGSGARLILQNPDDSAIFARLGLVDPERIRLIAGSGVDCSRFSLAYQRPILGSLRIVLPARLLWDKGVREYVEAARLLLAEGREIDFLIAGEPDYGNPAAVPEEEVRAWEREGLVKWLGHVADMPGLFGSVHAAVLPSYREGLPKSLIEAGASGLPLVTTDVPGCREVVENEVDGLLVPARDAKALATAIARLADDPSLRQRLGAAARQKAISLFDEQIIIQKTIAVYRELSPVGYLVSAG